MNNYVFGFSLYDDPDRAVLGGKGADLVEMTRIGLPVPPGFIIGTHACLHYLRQQELPAGLLEEVDRQLRTLEGEVGRRFGDEDDPLLLSARSGAAISMPGMMDTVLDLGLNDRSVEGLARRTGDLRFALDSYRRLVQMFGETVLGVPARAYADSLAEARAAGGCARDQDLTPEALRGVVQKHLALTEEYAGRPFPQDPHDQLAMAVEAVFRSWGSERAVAYRHHYGIPDDLGTAVTIQTMVFGNRGPLSGSGVCFTRSPETGERGDYGEYLPMAQGEDVVSGVRDALPLSELRVIDPASYRRLRSLLGTLERHYRDLCDVEFTIESGHLWVLQTRIGKRSAAAAFRIASDLVDDGWIDLDEALRRVSGEQLAQLMSPGLDVAGEEPLTIGTGAAPGSAVGRIALDSATAAAWAAEGDRVLLVREETRPEDLPGLLVAAGVLTSRGGRTSHAAVVARGLGRPCVCGAAAMTVDLQARTITVEGTTLQEGTTIAIDGETGGVYVGEPGSVESPVVRWLEGEDVPADRIDAVARLLAHADAVRRLRVRANADTATDARRAVRFGAEGVGLCRTEHLFLGERRVLVERVILAATASERAAAVADLMVVLRSELTDLFVAMDGRPVTIRLLDPPLHEFVSAAREDNPMMGLRGVRLAVLFPDLLAAQARAIFEAATAHRADGGSVDLEVLVPLVADERELSLVAEALAEVAADVASASGLSVDYRVGAMIETPRAALTADQIAAHADFLSFGTNDLTQLTWGLSRDDAEGSFLPVYVDRGLVERSPFQTIDPSGVGWLVQRTVAEARSARAEISLGVCGEHGGDPTSIAFFDAVGLDYVSCSPFRVPIARLEAGRAALGARSDAEEVPA